MKNLFSLITLMVLTTINSFGLFRPSNSNFDFSKTLSNYHVLEIDKNIFESIVKSKPDKLDIQIPGINKTVHMSKWSPLNDDFKVLLGSGKDYNPEKSTQYKGIIEGEKRTVVSFSFSSDGVMGLICNDEGNYVIGRINGSEEYILYNDRDMKKKFSFMCDTDTQSDTVATETGGLVSSTTNKCIKWYYETDYDLFVNKGSVSAVNSYVQGIFGQVATLYANDGMSIQLQTLFIWDVSDPYTGTTTTNYLSQFGAYRTSFSGDLAHLIGLQGGGGVAFVNTLCSTNIANRMAYSAINPTYQNVPTYSWTVEVVAHESGHNVASKHTHDCVWNGNNTPIDGCGPTAGYTTSCTVGPLPSNGGTIMSYCHLISSVGINFNNGFGPQPTTLMVNTISAKTCLVSCDSAGNGSGGGGTGCTVPVQPGTISGVVSPCVGVTGIYSVAPVIGATSYTWQLPSGWSIQTGTASNTNSVSITAGSGSGNIAVFAVNNCGSSSPRTLYVTPQTAPATPSSITGPLSVCSGQQGVTYSILPIGSATSYTWTAPSGSVIIGSTNNTFTTSSTSISVNFGTKKGKIGVKSSNVCGTSGIKYINISFNCRESVPGISIDANFNIYTNSDNMLRIYDISGKIVLESKNNRYVDTSSLMNGMYLIEFDSNTQRMFISR